MYINSEQIQGENAFHRDVVRIAYVASVREWALEEPLHTDEGVDVSSTHRGSIPQLLEHTNMHNFHFAGVGDLPRMRLALILADDDVPYRDFLDLDIPVHLEPSSTFASIRVPRTGGEAAEESARRAKADAKSAYEQRLLAVLDNHSIDIVVSDRYMRVFGPTFLDRYLGLTLNSHPARLPGLEGKTPTADAMARARDTGYAWHGNTFHFVDAAIDHGPPIAQVETTPVLATDTHQQLRYRNRLNEHGNILEGLDVVIRDPQIYCLIELNRALRAGMPVQEEMRCVRARIISRYQQSFADHRRAELASPAEPGTFKYNAFMHMEAMHRRDMYPATRPVQQRALVHAMRL